MADEVRLIDANSLLKGIEELKESPWFKRGKLEETDTNVDYNRSLFHIGYLERKEAIEIIIDLCIKKEPTIEVEPVNGWISVKDRLPEKDGRYVVWSDGELNICEYDVKSQTFGDTFYDYDEMYSKLLCWDDDINKFVTHWQPLPEPPKEEDYDLLLRPNEE